MKRKQMQLHGDLAGQKVITSEEIIGNQNVAIGRGAQSTVTPLSNGHLTAALVSDKAYSFDFSQLSGWLHSSNLPSPLKEKMNEKLQLLRSETEQGEGGNVQKVRLVLQEIANAMPELRQPLWRWLSSTSTVTTPIRIIARRLLT